jgi:alpha-galactosidase
MPTDSQGAILQLTAAGVSVLIDARGGQLPAIVHWGSGLPATAKRPKPWLGPASR